MVGQALNKIRLTSPEEDIVAIAVTKYGCIRSDSSIIKRIEPVKRTKLNIKINFKKNII
jgi:hypothetical protein